MRCGTISGRLVSKVLVSAASAKLMDLFRQANFDFLRGEMAVHYCFAGAERDGVDQHSSPDSNVPPSAASGNGTEGPSQDRRPCQVREPGESGQVS
jgi:hypothetical protein